METQSIFLICPDCQTKVRQLTKDLDAIDARVCPTCGTTINVKDIREDKYALSSGVINAAT